MATCDEDPYSRDFALDGEHPARAFPRSVFRRNHLGCYGAGGLRMLHYRRPVSVSLHAVTKFHSAVRVSASLHNDASWVPLRAFPRRNRNADCLCAVSAGHHRSAVAFRAGGSSPGMAVEGHPRFQQ